MDNSATCLELLQAREEGLDCGPDRRMGTTRRPIPKRYLELADSHISKAIIPVDRWPYTDVFEEHFATFCEAIGKVIPRSEFWRITLSARKRRSKQSRD